MRVISFLTTRIAQMLQISNGNVFAAYFVTNKLLLPICNMCATRVSDIIRILWNFRKAKCENVQLFNFQFNKIWDFFSNQMA